MRYIVHKDNLQFWINACIKALEIYEIKLRNDIQYLKEVVEYNRQFTPHKFNTDIYRDIPSILEYLKNADGTNIELNPQAQKYILERSNMFEEYVLTYNKEKDEVVQ